MNTSLFLALLTAHLLGDYFFQWEAFCNNKRSKGLTGYALYVHAVIVFLVTMIAVEPSIDKLASYGWGIYVCVASIAFSHFLIDIVKSAIENKIRKNKSLSIVEFGPFIFLSEKQAPVPDKDIKSYTLKSLWLYLGDQLLHIAVLVGVSMLCDYECVWTKVIFANNLNLGLVIVAFLLCGKAGNHFMMPFIQFVFSNSKQSASSSEKKATNVHAGAMIGILERWLILICLLAGQYEPIGFLVAAKSIIRYKEADTSTTEYVLAGTLFSIAIAVICGIAVIVLS